MIKLIDIFNTKDGAVNAKIIVNGETHIVQKNKKNPRVQAFGIEVKGIVMKDGFKSRIELQVWNNKMRKYEQIILFQS